MSIKIHLTHSISSEEMEKREKRRHEKALSYLKAKYPGVSDVAFFTDSTGQVYSCVVDAWAVAEAAEIEEICGKCKGGECPLSEKTQKVRPVVRVSKSPRGYNYVDVRWTSGIACKYEPLSGKFEEMYKQSGISGMYKTKTFKNYDGLEDVTEAKTAAIEASQTGSNLILAGKAGTGKTHLAAAIAIKAMKEGRQALFRLVSAMLDEIQKAIRDGGDYDGLMRRFKTVPCLVLDDLGHENMTSARGSYLHQIIDYRYVHKLQTIITTNAKTIAELCEWDKEEYVMPIVSRILERGKWVQIENAEDYRKKRGADRDGEYTEE